MICPVCGNNSPDSMRECQFCSTPLTPVASAAPAAPSTPQYNPNAAQYGVQPQRITQPYGTGSQQSPYGVQPYGAAAQQTSYGTQPYGAAAQQSPYGTQPYGAAAQQSPYGVQPYGAAAQQSPYGTQPYGVAAQQSPYGTQPYGTAEQPVQNPNNAESAEGTDAASPAEDETDAEVEKKVSTGTLTALLVWFAFIAIAFAAIYFDLPGAVNKMIGSALPNLSASDVTGSNDSDAPADYTDNSQPPDDEPVLDALHGTWVLCTYYIQDLTTNEVTGGQHYTHSIPLQFYSFNAGALDRCSGSAAAALTHEALSYSYIGSTYSGPLIKDGTSAPSVVLSGSYMCIYDTFEINGVSCYVEYALLRVFDEPASDEAIVVYAEAIENGTVALPQYTSSVMANPSMVTTSSTTVSSQVTATYGMLGTWLLMERSSQQFESGQPVGDSIKSTISEGTLDYNYAVFTLDNSFQTFRFRFSDDMSECTDESRDSGYFEFNDGLLSFAPASSKTSVSVSSDLMYMEYDVTKDGITTHYRDMYKSISSEVLGYDELIELRPSIG